MRGIAAVTVLLALAAGCATTPVTSSSASGHAQAADAAVKVFVDAWNRAASGNVEGPQLYGTLYWPDAELVDPSGNIWQGQPAIVQMHVDLWNSVFKGSVVSGAVRRTRQLSPTSMIADFDLALKVAGPLPPVIPSTDGVVKAHLKHVMEKRGSEWKVVAAQNTFYSDAPRR